LDFEQRLIGIEISSEGGLLWRDPASRWASRP